MKSVMNIKFTKFIGRRDFIYEIRSKETSRTVHVSKTESKKELMKMLHRVLVEILMDGKWDFLPEDTREQFFDHRIKILFNNGYSCQGTAIYHIGETNDSKHCKFDRVHQVKMQVPFTAEEMQEISEMIQYVPVAEIPEV